MVALVLLCGSLVSACYVMRPSSGAGQAKVPSVRQYDPAGVVLPSGYRVERVASGLTFPVGIAFDDQNRAHVVESGYSYGEVFTEPRLLRLENDGGSTPVATGGKGGPWTGVAFAAGSFFVADGNVLEGGRLLRITADGRVQVLVSGLPSFGDHHTNSPVVGRDGWIYFSQGTATNAGVVGEDNLKYGWLKRKPDFHDVPGADVTLAGRNFETADVLNPDSARKAVTGAFLPFGTPSQPGQVIRGQVRCSGGILRVRPGGGEPELVAWGFRNPFGLAFSADGTLYATDNGYDDRGSRGVWGAPDVLWRVQPGQWYGWPDFVAGMPITASRFKPPGKPRLQMLLAHHPNPPPDPVAQLAVHGSANGLDFSTSQGFGYAGEAFIAIFGDQAPAVGKILGPVGGKVVRVDPASGVIRDFAVNRAPREGPASKVGGGGLERPVSVRFDRRGEALYVVDFGVLHMNGEQSEPQTGTGAIWRIRREDR